MRIFFTLFLGIYFLSTQTSFAQGRAERWYFGLNAGLDFNSGSPVAVTDGALSTSEGCSSIADTSGNLLFYTDGITVYNRQHTAMPNSGDLMGDVSTTQSALIVPMPGDTNIYYIFTLPPDGNSTIGFRYSVVDMSLDNGLGDVTSDKNILVLSDVAEKVSAVSNHDGTAYWIMVHDYPGDGFYAYSLDASGFNTTPVISHTGTVHMDTIIQNSYGYMKFSPGGNRLALAIGYQGLFEVFDFNDITGVVSNPISLNTADRCYGVEFSRDNSKLYITHYSAFNDQYFLDQYDVSSGDYVTIILSMRNLGSPDGARALQLGPDGKIYLAKAFQSYLGVINYPDSSGSACDFQDNSLYLDIAMCAIGLPGFVQSELKDKLGNTVGIPDISKEKLSLFPNPAGNNINLLFSADISSDFHLDVQNMSGELMKITEMNVEQNHIIIGIPNLAPGYYIAHCRNSNEVFSAGFIKR